MTVLPSKSKSSDGGDRLVLEPADRGLMTSEDLSIPGFELLECLGRGGMSRVYRARNIATGREVALKTVSMLNDGDSSEHGHRVERLLSEAGLLTGLRHPNLVPVYGIGHACDQIYVSMRYASGGDLQSRVRQGLEPVDALAITADIARALHFAHERGLVHRDVKPGNILFDTDGVAMLSDFGLAKPYRLQVGLTAVGMILGSPAYMCPEQALSGPVTQRSDVYALGGTLYTALTGRLPYRDKSPLRVIRMHMDAPLPQLPDDLNWLQPLIGRSMAKDPDARFASAGMMADALDSAAKAMQRFTNLPLAEDGRSYLEQSRDIAPSAERRARVAGAHLGN
ncbi:MAG: serine/threonine-protein kinase [Pseudomonadota bacterium]